MEWMPDKLVKRGFSSKNITGFGDEEDCIVGPSPIIREYTKRGSKCGEKTTLNQKNG
jgi:hypothetical protein